MDNDRVYGGANVTLNNMLLLSEHGDASDATVDAPDMPEPLDTATDTTDSGVAGVAALADDLDYTLTIGQAMERFAAASRAVPSMRSMQRYCAEHQLAAKKIRTVFGSEWLINEFSLMRLIESEPIITGDVGDATSRDTATSATPSVETSFSHQPVTTDSGVAGVANRAAMATPVGETRTIAEVLIENARLLAQVEGRDAIITELKEDRTFLREEVREGRKTRDDVKNIAERMLDTLKTMAIGRVALTSQTPESVHATVIDPDNRQL